MNNLLNNSNVKLFIKINLNLSFDILVNTVLLRCNYHDVLLQVHLEKLWLSEKRNVELIDRIN